MKRILSLGLLLILVLLVLFLGIQTNPAQAQQGGFFEPFDDPEMPGWDRNPGAEIVDGVLTIGAESFVHRPGEWSELELSIRARHMTPADFVVSFRTAGSEGYHLLLGMGSITLQQESNGEVQHLESSEFPEIGVGEWFELTLVALDENITVSINQGEPLLVVSNVGPSNSGGLSIQTFPGSEIQVDEISLIIPGDEVEQEETNKESSQTNTEGSTVGDLPVEPWVRTGGPSGGLGYDIRMDPRDTNVMYVTDAYAGAFKSIDGGKNWFPINDGITSRVGPSADGVPVFSLTVDPNNPDTLWVGTNVGGGVFRSDDGGESWRQMTNGILEQSLVIRGFSVEPGNSDVVYLAGEIGSWEWNGSPLNGLGFDLTRGAVYKSTDRGENWNRIWYGDHLARYVLIHPDNHEKLYVSTGIFDREAANSNPETLEPGGVGVVRSSDGGKTWEALGVSRGFRYDELYIGSLAMHPTKPEILFAAAGSDAHLTALDWMIGAIYRTSDGGDSWERVLDLPNASAVEICEGDPNVVYAGASSFFYRSDDGGTSWQIKSGTEGDLSKYWGPEEIVSGFPIDMQCDPDDPMRVFVNNYGGGNVVTTDGGTTWFDASDGYTGALMDTVVSAPGAPALVFSSARSGIFKSTDGGENWEGMSRGAARSMEAYAIAVNPWDHAHLIAEVVDAGAMPKISYDSGNTWQNANPQVNNMEGFRWETIKKVAFSPTEPGRVIGIEGEKKCDQHGTKTCFENEGMGVVYSKDGGENWSISNLRDRLATELVFAQDGSAYVVLFLNDLYRSIDGGETWTLVSENNSISVLNRDPDSYPPVLIALEVDPEDPSRLYAGYTIGGVNVSEDGGATWTHSSVGMVPEAAIFDLVADRAHPGVIYAASRLSGVYRSVDDGTTWQAINDGLSNRAALSLSLSIDGSYLYVATEGGGVFRLSPDGKPPLEGVVETLDDQEEQQVDEAEPDQITEDTDQDIPPVIDEKNQPRENNLGGWVLGGVLLVVLGGILGFVLAKSRRET